MNLLAAHSLAYTHFPSAPMRPGTRLIDVSNDGQRSRLLARSTDKGFAMTEISGPELRLEIKQNAFGFKVQGRANGKDVDLVAVTDAAGMEVEGDIGGHEVGLRLQRWGNDDEASLRGLVGGRRVQLTRHAQLDGSVLSGYVGGRRFSIREREMPSECLNLDSALYLAPLLVSLAPPAEPGRIDYVA